MSADDGLGILYGPVTKDLRQWMLERRRLRKRLEEVETYIKNSNECPDLEGAFLKLIDEDGTEKVLCVIVNCEADGSGHYKCVKLDLSDAVSEVATCYFTREELIEAEELSQPELASIREYLLNSPEGMALKALFD